MAGKYSRRSFVNRVAAGGLLAAVGDVGLFSQLQPVSAAESKLPAGAVQFRSEIEPLVRLLEETPRDKLLEEIGTRIRGGLSYREVLTAILLAGIRNVQPRPLGFKFHAVLVVNSAHLASIHSPDEHRWLPIFWALDYFKEAQAENKRQGDWTMPALDESKLPDAAKVNEAFAAAMDSWDEGPADAAAAGLARNCGANDAFEQLFRYGCRDFRDIGHKAIYVSNSWRALGTIGEEHIEPVVRSLAYALLDRGNDRKDADAPADRPIERNRELAAKFPAEWMAGKTDDAATVELLATLRGAKDDECCSLVVEMLNRGISPQSIWDALHLAAGELLMRQPGIVALHSVTSTNALHFAFNTTASDETRRLLLLQNAAFLPLFRQAMTGRGQLKDLRVDELKPEKVAKEGTGALDEIFADISGDRASAAAKVLAYLDDGGDVQSFINAARILVFLKGNNAHDYKFSSAVLEDYYHLSPAWRNRYLASSVFNLRGSGHPNNPLVERARAALRA
jgi:hypothetical protein